VPNLFSTGVNLSSQETNVLLNELVAKTMAANPQPPRRWLGASIVGHESLRQVQFRWWCRVDIPSRVRLIFERGHLLEAIVKSQLEEARLVFASTGLEFKAFGGILQGHADGVVIRAPKVPGLYLPPPFVWENKAVNAKNFRAVDKRGLLSVFPHDYRQVGLYQRYLGKLNPALVTIVNSDTGEVLYFKQPYDEQLTDSTVENAKTIIEATKRGELLPRAYSDPCDWRCEICPFRQKCWGALLPQTQGAAVSKHPARANLKPETLVLLDKMFGKMSSDNPHEAGVAAVMFFKAARADGIDLQTLRDRVAKSWMSDEDAQLFRDTIAKAKEAGKREALLLNSAPRSDDFERTDGRVDWREIAKYVDRERHRLPARNQNDKTFDFINSMPALAMSTYPKTLSEPREKWPLDRFGKLGGKVT
jgi:hypothetical protein